MNQTKLKNKIFEFLDDYYGSEIYVNKILINSFSYSGSTNFTTGTYDYSSRENPEMYNYQICSPKGGPILSFNSVCKTSETLSILCEADATRDISTIFNIGITDSVDYVREWFGNLHSTGKEDFTKFMEIAK